MQALVLAAGKGTRMKSSRPKVLHEILGKPLVGYVLDTLAALGISPVTVVVGAGGEDVRGYLKTRPEKIRVVWQREQKGTGHAVEMARKPATGSGDVLIWPGDMPLLKRETLAAFINEHKAAGAAASVLSALQPEPYGYGRMLRAGGKFYGIREELDASEAERRIQEVNTGVYLFGVRQLFDALKKVKPANEKREYYLTDTIEILTGQGQVVEAFPLAEAREAQGINSRHELAEATETMRNREIQAHMERGVSFVSPDQTFVEPGVKIGEDTVIYPWCYIESGVVIGKNCSIGPFAKIRKGSTIGDECTVGSFVEVNRSKLGKGVLAKHLAYLGDATLGDATNVGAGTITANFDGKNKHATRIGKKVLIGSNTVLVAPVAVDDGAKTGAGSVVTKRVRKGQVVVGVPARPLAKNK
jgi:bifunctional UDP-N-acetylglucosamine pyrophosphorylase / glucosamine-1-phosphate N-acetyltransferase